jgi:hypothetical protein
MEGLERKDWKVNDINGWIRKEGLEKGPGENDYKKRT